MKSLLFRRVHQSRTACLWTALFVSFTILIQSAAATALAQLPNIVRVEEDWELVVASPDTNSTGPQITCVWSPLGHADSTYATLEINHQSLPEFQPGGLQLQIWDGDIPLQNRKFPQPNLMQTTGETVRWTQCIESAVGTLTFEILNGTSATWGSFGGQGYLTASVSSNLQSLNAYDPAVSTAHSGIGYAANRVQSLVLLRVRMIADTTEVFEFNTPTVVYPKE